MFEKENINIDDLVRSKMTFESDASGRSQAWEKMDALLDDNQRKVRAIPFWKNKWVLPVALLLFSAIIGTGYWIDNRNKLITYTSDNPQFNNIAQSNTKYITRVDDSLKSKPIINENSIENKTSSQHLSTSSSDASNSIVKKVSKVEKERNSNNLLVTNKSINKDVSSLPANHTKVNIENSGHVKVEANGIANSHSKLNVPINKLVNDYNESNSKELFTDKDLASTQEKLKTLAEEGKLLVNRSENNLVQIANKSYPSIKVVNETVHVEKENSYSSYDTVHLGRIERVKFISLSEIEIAALKQLDIFIPSEYSDNLVPLKLRAHNSLNNESVASQTLASNDVSNNKETNSLMTEKSKAEIILADMNNFFEIRNKFYINVFGGFNTTPNNFFPLGLNAGVGIHYWLGKKFSLGTELGYAFRPITYTLLDEATEFTQIGPGTSVAAGMMYNYNEKKTTKQYQLNYIQGFDLPLLLSYHSGKYSLYGGPMLSTLLPLRYQKTELVTSDDKMVVLSSGEGFNYESTQLTSQSNDFNARFGFGAMAGVNYQINRNLGISFRYSQIFTDNSNTINGQKLSKNMFHLPSFRLGLVYKFGNGNSVQYMMSPK